MARFPLSGRWVLPIQGLPFLTQGTQRASGLNAGFGLLASFLLRYEGPHVAHRGWPVAGDLLLSLIHDEVFPLIPRPSLWPPTAVPSA